MFDALIIIFACNASHPETQCVPYFVERTVVASEEDCAERISDILEVFAPKAPATTILRGQCRKQVIESDA